LYSVGEYEVIITGRNKVQGESIAASIGKGVKFLALDLASQSSVRTFVEELKETIEHPLKSIICNAGLQLMNMTTMNEDGFEMTFAVNHLGHFLLINLLLPILSRPGRIIIVASGTHDPDQETGIEPPRYTTAENISRGKLEGETVLSGMKSGQCAYSTSKLCNVLCAFELNRKLKQLGVNDIYVNAFDPGLTTGTKLARHYGFIISGLFQLCPAWILQKLWANVHPVNESGASLAALATKKDFDKLCGFYFEHEDKTPFVAESSDDSKCNEFAEDLWDWSIKATGLTPLEERFPNSAE